MTTSVAKYVVYVLLAVFLAACSAESEPQPQLFHGPTMGTTYSVTLPQLPQGLAFSELQARFDQLLVDINAEMSTYQSDSAISQFNRSEDTAWFSVSTSFVHVVQSAQRISELSLGAYDITLGPLVELWGFGAKMTADGQDLVPSDNDIAAVLATLGYGKLTVQEQPPALRKALPELRIDLSSIAKGYAVDVIADYLESAGAQDYLVEIGGELRASGLSARQDDWRIAVEKPVVGERSIQRVIALKDMSVATSGDYRNFFEQQGKRYSHMIDAKTGKPVTHNLASVTVLSPKAMDADGWATALMALGEDAGYELADQQNIAAYFIYRDGSGVFQTKETKAFTKIAGSNV